MTLKRYYYRIGILTLCLSILFASGCTKSDSSSSPSTAAASGSSGAIALPAPDIINLELKDDYTFSLLWNQTNKNGIIGYTIYFKKPLENSFSVTYLEQLTTQLSNSSLKLDKGFGTYFFKLKAETATESSPFSTIFTYTLKGFDSIVHHKTMPSGSATDTLSFDNVRGLFSYYYTTTDQQLLFIADSYNNRVLKLDPSNSRIIGAYPLDSSLTFNAPSDIVIDSSDKMWVIDTLNNRFVISTVFGAAISDPIIVAGFNNQTDELRAIAIEGTTIFIANNNEIYKVEASFVSENTTASDIKKPENTITIPDVNGFITDLAIFKDTSNTVHLFACDKNSSTIFWFNSSDNFQTPTTIGGLGSGKGKLQNPQGIAVDSNGNLFVADTLNHRIQVFTKESNYSETGRWGMLGSYIGQFNHPISISIDKDNFIYVGEGNPGNNRIQVFKK